MSGASLRPKVSRVASGRYRLQRDRERYTLERMDGADWPWRLFQVFPGHPLSWVADFATKSDAIAYVKAQA